MFLNFVICISILDDDVITLVVTREILEIECGLGHVIGHETLVGKKLAPLLRLHHKHLEKKAAKSVYRYHGCFLRSIWL